MGFNIKQFGKVALTVGGVMVPQIAQAEAAFKQVKSGPDKKKAVINAVRSSVELSELLSGQEIADEALLFEGLSDINDGYVKVMRALHPVEEEVKP